MHKDDQGVYQGTFPHIFTSSQHRLIVAIKQNSHVLLSHHNIAHMITSLTSSKGSVDADGLRETTKRLTSEIAMLKKQNSDLEEQKKSLSKR